MKLKIGKPELEGALKTVTPAINISAGDLSSHFVIRVFDDGAGGAEAEILGSSGRVFASSHLPCNDIEVSPEEALPFLFTVSGKRLNLWVKALPESVKEISLKFDGTKVQASAGKGKNAKIPSLDPTSFPFWDETMQKVTLTAKLKADRLSNVLSYSKEFVSDQESRNPQLCVAELRRGCLCSTNKTAASVVFPAGMEESTIRLHGKDFSSILSFLSQVGDQEVEILESERVIIFRREDGSLFGESRFRTALPDLTINREEKDIHWWTVSKAELLSAISLLIPSAAWDDYRVGFELDEENDDGGVIRLSMAAVSGGEIVTEIPCIDMELNDDVMLPKFNLHYPSLQKVLSYSEQDDVRFGINPQKKKAGAGWVAFREDRGGDHYLTIMAWLA